MDEMIEVPSQDDKPQARDQAPTADDSVAPVAAEPESPAVDVEPLAIDAESSAVDAESAAIDVEPSAVETEPAAIATEPPAEPLTDDAAPLAATETEPLTVEAEPLAEAATPSLNAAVIRAPERGKRRRRMWRALPIALTFLLLVGFAGALMLQGSGGASGGSTALAPTATATDTATATATATNTATATAKPKPTATLPPVAYQPPKITQGGGGPPPPPPPSQGVPPGPAPAGGTPNINGQVILINIGQQWLWVYQNRQLVYDTPVTTGMPELATPQGIFDVQWRETNVVFTSPWPPGSPYYYTPEHINYAMYFAWDGYFIHDAPWRNCFGPGTNVPHTCSNGASETGSHGCVNVPTPAGAWLYYHTYNGATVDIINLAAPAYTPTPSPTASPTPSPSPSPTDSPVPTDTPTDTPIPTDTPA